MISNLEKKIAFRYLKTRKKDGFLNVISIFSFIGISLGVAVLIIVMSVMNGFRSELVNKIIGFNSHVIIQSQNETDDTSLLNSKYIKSDNFGGTNDALYYSAGISVPVADVLSFDANIGYYDFTGGGNFADWNIGTTLNVYDVFDADLRYYDTDVSTGCVSSCESRVVFSIARSF